MRATATVFYTAITVAHYDTGGALLMTDLRLAWEALWYIRMSHTEGGIS